MKNLGLFIALSLVLTACGGSGGDSAPSNANVAGTWIGTASVPNTNTYVNVALTMTQSGGTLTGTYACGTGTSTCVHSTGSMSGTISGNSFTGGITFPDSHTAGFTGTVSGTTLSGVGSCSDPLCPVGNGTFSVTKQ
jgi:hypothetical protein